MAAATNPLHATHPPPSPTVSSETHTIAGILVTVHGLSELPPSTTSVACLWLLHPRLQTRETMAPLAAQIITTWNTHNRTATSPKSTKGLIALAFDQRNHGTRLVTSLHNQAWKQGNPRHAQDMFSCYHGTALDTSQLIDHIGSYILTARPGPVITQHLTLGVSLGGHAVWHVLLSDPRVTAGVVGIGCPDYTRLMSDRARLSRRETYTSTTPPGGGFLGSRDFPAALREAVAKEDPAGLLLPGYFNPTGADPLLSPAQLERFQSLVQERFSGKRILNLSGGADKLVPYAAGKPFLDVFTSVLDEEKSLDVRFEDVVFEGEGHAIPKSMADKAAEWICEVLIGDEGRDDGARVESKI